MTSPGRHSLCDAGLAYHAATGDVIAFGGVGRDADEVTHPTDATWSWTHGTWQPLDPPVKPAARQNPLLVGDCGGDVLLFAGSARSTPSPNPRPTPSPGQPQLRPHHTTTVTHHADAWRWDGRTWEPLEYHDHVRGVLTYDQTRQRPVLVGTVGPPGDIRGRRATWAWTGSTWTILTPSVPQDELSALTDDPRSGQLVGFAGRNPIIPPRTRPASGRPAQSGFARTWVLHDEGWRPAAEPFPEPVSGVLAPNPGTEDILAITQRGHTWRREPDGWVHLSVQHSLPATDNRPGAQWTAVRTRTGILLVITYPSTDTETWIWDGVDWRQTSREPS